MNIRTTPRIPGRRTRALPVPAPPGSAVAEAVGLRVARGRRAVLDGVDVAVRAGEVLSRVYRQPVEVFPHPRTGVPVVLPARNHKSRQSTPLDHPLTNP
ncbi:hypothetical protein [Streptomyces sp. NPDC046371]|uniref:hypothetical protein n=1 Tax=unclassified Streptomyces TaxID=2593676 RepID=UPI0033C16449